MSIGGQLVVSTSPFHIQVYPACLSLCSSRYISCAYVGICPFLANTLPCWVTSCPIHTHLDDLPFQASMFLPGHSGHNFGDSLNADSVLLALCLDFSIMPRVSNVGFCTIGGCSNCSLTQSDVLLIAVASYLRNNLHTWIISSMGFLVSYCVCMRLRTTRMGSLGFRGFWYYESSGPMD